MKLIDGFVDIDRIAVEKAVLKSKRTSPLRPKMLPLRARPSTDGLERLPLPSPVTPFFEGGKIDAKVSYTRVFGVF